MADEHPFFGDEPSFFGVFSYGDMMHDAVDRSIVYDYIQITRDVTTASGLVLKKGDRYDSVWINFQELQFQFIIWKKNDDDNFEARPDSVFIPMSELAPFLCWNEKDIK